VASAPWPTASSLGIGVADPDDLDAVAARLAALGGNVKQTLDAVAAVAEAWCLTLSCSAPAAGHFHRGTR